MGHKRTGVEMTIGIHENTYLIMMTLLKDVFKEMEAPTWVKVPTYCSIT